MCASLALSLGKVRLSLIVYTCELDFFLNLVFETVGKQNSNLLFRVGKTRIGKYNVINTYVKYQPVKVPNSANFA